MFQFLTHVEPSGSMVAILEMPQYVAYQKNVAYMFFFVFVFVCLFVCFCFCFFNSVQSLTVLTFCAQWICLAAI